MPQTTLSSLRTKNGKSVKTKAAHKKNKTNLSASAKKTTLPIKKEKVVTKKTAATTHKTTLPTSGITRGGPESGMKKSALTLSGTSGNAGLPDCRNSGTLNEIRRLLRGAPTAVRRRRSSSYSVAQTQQGYLSIGGKETLMKALFIPPTRQDVCSADLFLITHVFKTFG